MTNTNQIVEFLNALSNQGVPIASLQDHILSIGKPSSYPEFISMRSGAQRRLREGGSHHALLGVVVAPSPYKRGRAPKWCGDTAAMENTVGLDAEGKIDPNRWMRAPAVMLAMNTLSRITGEELSELNNNPRYRVLSKGGKRMHTAAFSVINELLEDIETKNNELASAKETIKLMKENFNEAVDERIQSALLEFSRKYDFGTQAAA